MSTNSLVELMNMVERWRARTGFGPVVVVSPYETHISMETYLMKIINLYIIFISIVTADPVAACTARRTRV